MTKPKTYEAFFALSGLVALVGVVASGCSGELPASGANAPSQVTVIDRNSGFDVPEGGDEAEADTPTDGDLQFGKLTGRILFSGSAPALEPPDPSVCKAPSTGSEKLVVNNGGVKNVFVYLEKPPKAKPPKDESAEEPKQVVFNNVACRFEPHCLIVGLNETIKVTNSDPVVHNTHTLPVSNSVFNQSLPQNGEAELSYAIPELVAVKCDVHAWMSAWHLAARDPNYATVTDEEGNFELTLPYGKHRVTIFHEAGISERVMVDVKAPEVPFEKTYGDLKVGAVRPTTELVISYAGH